MQFNRSRSNLSPTRPLSPKNEQLIIKSTNYAETKSQIQSSATLKECIARFRKYTQIKSLYSLSEKQLQALNDNSSKYYLESKVSREPSKFEKAYYSCNRDGLKSLIRTLMHNLNTKSQTTIPTHHPIVIILNTVKLMIILHCLFLFPLSDAFDSEIENMINKQQPIFICEWIILILDLFMRFNIQLYKKGMLITQQRQVVIIYIRKRFIYDLIGIIGYSLFLFFPTTWLKYLFVVKYKDLANFLKYIRIDLDPNLKFKNHLQLLRLLFIVIVLAHLFASIWVGVGKMNNEKNWIEYRQLQQASWGEIYLNALYFSITTMTTVGFGDITAQNSSEISIAICLTLFSSCVFAYIFNTITQILKDISDDKKKITIDIQLMKNYMRKRGIDRDLQAKVSNYLKMIYKHGPSDTEQNVFQKLSPALKNEIDEMDKGLMLLKQPFLVNNFSFQFLKSLVPKVKEINYQPDELLPKQKGLFIIYKGSFKIKLHEGHEIGSLGSGDIFGLLSLFNQNYQNIDVQTDEFAIIYYLSEEDFINNLKDKDLEQYQVILDKVRFGNIDNLFLKCILCKKKGHELCEELQHVANKNLVITKYLFDVNQRRQKYKRKNKKIKTFNNLVQKQRKAYIFQTKQKSVIKRFESTHYQLKDEILESSENSIDDSYDEIEHIKNCLDENKQKVSCEYVKTTTIKPFRTSNRGPSIIRMLQGYTQQKLWHDQFVPLENFDTKKNYVLYYPQYNSDLILKSLNQLRKNKMKQYNQIFSFH